MNTLLAFFIIVFVVIGCVGMLVSLYNRLVMLRHNVDKSFANIDVLLKQRVDELPELLKVVKASTEYEKDTLLQLTQLRTAWLASNRSEDKVRLSNELNHALKGLFAVAENYPQLKASRGFIQLQRVFLCWKSRLLTDASFLMKASRSTILALVIPCSADSKIYGVSGKAVTGNNICRETVCWPYLLI
jgi:hypothetical protein